MSKPNGLTYADAGVDIDAGNEFVNRIKPHAKSTNRDGVMAGIGGFGAMFDLKAAGFDDPILVSATDGVGTKLKIAIDTGKFDTIGIDLVAMCVNDLICQGALPLFFLDYFATGKLELDRGEAIVAGIAEGCRQSESALIGGETAEMPGMYQGEDFDLAGFAVGAMERGQYLPRDVAAGDVIIGLTSSGVHSNGYSLVRKTVELAGLSWEADCPFADGVLGDHLLAPTKIYVKATKALLNNPALHGLAHITGGGLVENLPRALPDGLGLTLDLDAWDLPPIFEWLIKTAGLEQSEALKTYNCGIGLCLIVAPEEQETILEHLSGAGETPKLIGTVSEEAGTQLTGRLCA